MLAAVFKGAGQPWLIEDRPDPEPLAGEAVIRVGRCGICGTDISFTSGQGYDFPCDSVLGHEFAGEVVALGPHTSRLKVGDVVTAMPSSGCGHCVQCRAGHDAMCPEGTGYMGGFAQYMRIAERSSVVLPSALSLADGALVEPLAVGLHGVRLAEIGADSRVLVLGAGSVALGVIYWAARTGARVVAISRSGRQAGLAEAMGATRLVAAGDDEIKRVEEVLGGLPDVVFECIGVVGALGRSVSLVRPKGKVVSLGFCMKPDAITPGHATFREVSLQFSMTYTLEEFRDVVDQFDAGHVEPRELVTDTIGLEELPAQIERMRQGGVGGKIHVDPWRTV
jgi:threonine dehydrogenase-like Zn-dependent dehydrogenase